MNIENPTRTTKIVVIGGGYAGALAANRLQRAHGVEITLVNPRPLVLYLADQLAAVVSIEVVDGQITNFYAMRNPAKLAGVTVPRHVSR